MFIMSDKYYINSKSLEQYNTADTIRPKTIWLKYKFSSENEHGRLLEWFV